MGSKKMALINNIDFLKFIFFRGRPFLLIALGVKKSTVATPL